MANSKRDPIMNTESPEREAPVFFSLGMVVLDEIHSPNGEVLRDVPGGSGFYSTLGARLAVPLSEAGSVCCLVTAGRDFPDAVTEQIRGWGVGVHVLEVPDSMSTRGLLRYEDSSFEKKTFRYISPPLRPDIHSLPAKLLRSAVIHTLASPEDFIQQAESLGVLCAEMDVPRPFLAWEPFPLDCHRKTWRDHLRAAHHSDVFSPNDDEALAMAPSEKLGTHKRNQVEHAAILLSGEGVLPEDGRPDRTHTTVIRCGDQGCLTVPRAAQPVWLPAFHGHGSSKVVDATGAGNAFLGAFAVALKKTGDEVLASAYGSVAASFVIEQVGPPRREVVDGRELWNGEEFETRLRRYKDLAETCHVGPQNESLWRSDPRWCKRTHLFG